MGPQNPGLCSNTIFRLWKKAQTSSEREVNLEKDTDMFEEMKEVYNAISNGNWKFLIKHYKLHPEQLLFPLNLKRDSAFHLAIYSKKKEPFSDLFEIVKKSFENNENHAFKYVLLSENSARNNILHEAAIVGNIEVMKYLLHDFPEQVKNNDSLKQLADKILKRLNYVNLHGEVPIFTAAAYGKTKVVEFLAKQKGQMNELKEISEDSRTRHDGKSILQIAIEGEHFETALLLIKLDPSLAKLKDDNGMTALNFLANMPSSFKSRYTSDGLLDDIFYYCLPIQDIEDNDIPAIVLPKDIESGRLVSKSRRNTDSESGLGQLILQFIQGWPRLDRIWREKRKHVFALKLAKSLIELVSWKQFEYNQFNWFGTPLVSSNKPTPLYTATKNGIIEIVQELLKANPQAVEQHNEVGQNILHFAVMHRRKEIYYMIKDTGTPWVRITRKIDDSRFTLLHRVADTKHYTGGTKPGPALQLQEELLWFDRVKRAVPSYYAMLGVEILEEKDDVKDCANEIIHILKRRGKGKTALETNDGKEGDSKMMTPKEIFELKHKKQLEEAQIWIKETSQSCSTVAVLVATVVFAAAYTVPGGTNERGFPIFQDSPYFYFFTVMDVVALACSLTSVVAFLSILTSPFEFEDFRHSIPNKLSFGFTLLFFSVITTMLAFGATVLLVIRAEKNWTASLISVAAFLPVSVFALLQFRLYWTLIIDFFQALRGFLHCLGISSSARKKKQLLYIH